MIAAEIDLMIDVSVVEAGSDMSSSQLLVLL